MYRSRVTQKGQTTIPAPYRRKYRLREGSTVTFRETGEGLVIEPVPDIADSGGSMAPYGIASEIVADITRSRKESFR
jgi:AbrB family looped-hinge helix DNA binding protein